MYYCDKCGGKIENINEPCPTCGLYLHKRNDELNNNGVSKRKNNLKINTFFIVGVILVVIFTVFLVDNFYDKKIIKYEGPSYTLEYLSKKWKEYKTTDKDYFVLKYSDANDYLMLFNPVDLAMNLDDQEIREFLYQAYLLEFKNNDDIMFTDIMPEIKKIDTTDYYYLTADFQSFSNKNYNGKMYFIHTSSGKCLTMILVKGNERDFLIEKDIDEIIKRLKM